MSVYLYADVLLRLAEGCGVDVCWLVMYKVRFKNLVDFQIFAVGVTTSAIKLQQKRIETIQWRFQS